VGTANTGTSMVQRIIQRTTQCLRSLPQPKGCVHPGWRPKGLRLESFTLSVSGHANHL
jgi:hypothetical protein